MCLEEDYISDPPGIEVRAVQSIEGCMYLDKGNVGRALTYVMGPLIRNLLALGYEDGKNLFAAPVRARTLSANSRT